MRANLPSATRGLVRDVRRGLAHLAVRCLLGAACWALAAVPAWAAEPPRVPDAPDATVAPAAEPAEPVAPEDRVGTTEGGPGEAAPPAAPTPAGPGEPAAKPDPIGAVAGALVRVEYWLKANEEEMPEARGALVGRALLEEERPLELAGWLLSADRVIVPDPLIHPRFVRKTEVRLGAEKVEARICGYAEHQGAVYLALAAPLKGGRPLAFDPEAGPPYAGVTRTWWLGSWVAAAGPLSMQPALAEDGRRFVPVNANSLILGGNGEPAGLVFDSTLPADDSWKGSPLRWPQISVPRMERRLAAAERRADRGILRVTLDFRSPRRGSAEARQVAMGGDGGSTVRESLGVLVESKRLLVLEELRPAETARLERITVHGALGAVVSARFTATLADHGCLVAELSRPLPGAVKLSPDEIDRHRGELLTAAEIGHLGEHRLAIYEHCRLNDFVPRWKRRLYPVVSGGMAGCFLFDPAGNLVALPVTCRAPVTMTPPDPNAPARGPVLTPAVCIREALAALPAGASPANVPRTEEEEGRLAWLGVILQPMNRELARLQGVAAETADGSLGALVAHVYPGSPADRAGIRPGAILLRLHVRDLPLPIDVRLADNGGYYYDDEYYDEYEDGYEDDGYAEGWEPRPWAPAEDALTRALTDLGVGRAFTAELRIGPLTVRKPFKVEAGPAHFDSAPRHKSAELGLTVRDATYEVRHYYRLQAGDPGVIVSAVEPGSRAAVADIRTFEIITQVNGRAVASAAEFAGACEGQEELRLAVRRLARERQVKIRLPKATAGRPAAAGTMEPASSDVIDSKDAKDPKEPGK